MPKQSNIKTRVSRRKLDKSDGNLKAAFLSRDDVKQKKQKDDPNVDSTIDKNKRDTAELTPPRRIEVHQENRSTMDKMLRAFDLDYKYGPCVGLSRLQRWERAEALGLDPPPHIKSILVDKNNKDDQECLFYGSVI